MRIKFIVFALRGRGGRSARKPHYMMGGKVLSFQAAAMPTMGKDQTQLPPARKPISERGRARAGRSGAPDAPPIASAKPPVPRRSAVAAARNRRAMATGRSRELPPISSQQQGARRARGPCASMEPARHPGVVGRPVLPTRHFEGTSMLIRLGYEIAIECPQVMPSFRCSRSIRSGKPTSSGRPRFLPRRMCPARPIGLLRECLPAVHGA